MTLPIGSSVGSYIYRYQHRFAQYSSLLWRVIVSCALVHLWIKVGSLCGNQARVISPVMTALLATPERVHAMSEAEFIHNFIIFCSLLATLVFFVYDVHYDYFMRLLQALLD